MEQADLAEASGISLPTIKRLEKSDGPVGGLARTAEAVRKALENAGVEFLADGQSSNCGGVGLRLKPKKAAAEG